MGVKFALLIFCAMLLQAASADMPQDEARVKEINWSQLLVQEKKVKISPIKHKKLARLLKGNTNVESADCHTLVTDVLAKSADDFLTKMRSCPETPASQINFRSIQKPANEIKEILLDVQKQCRGLAGNCLNTNLAKYHEVNKLVIQIAKSIIYINAAKADVCKLPSARALLGLAITFISDITF